MSKNAGSLDRSSLGLPERETESREKKVEKVITGTVIQKKKSIFGKLKDALISEDSVPVKDYIIFDLAIPAFKELIVSSIEGALYGGARGGRRSFSSGSYQAPRYSYDRVSYNYNRPQSQEPKRPMRMSNYEDLVIADRRDAEHVLDRMCEYLDTYGQVTVADLYDLVGITSEFTDNKFGWTDLRTANIHPVRGGYLIRLPRAIAL